MPKVVPEAEYLHDIGDPLPVNLFDWLFLLCCALLLHAYWGYSWLIHKVAGLVGNRDTATAETRELPSVTVMLTVHNEEKTVGARIQNLLASEFDLSRLQILVCSDGSSDRTESIVSELSIQSPMVELFASGERLGKTGTQNRGLVLARNDVLVFTDADTEFAPDCLARLIEPFADPVVGGTTGALVFRSRSDTGVHDGQQTYWGQEMRVRADESALGWLCVATGACMAIRRELYCPPSPAHGEDCVLPLDVVLAGYRMVHVSGAVAYDDLQDDARAEYRSRVRMTERNWTGTLSRRTLLNPLRYPAQCFSLISHKLLKWMSPWLLILMLLSAVANVGDSVFYRGVLVVAGLGIAAAGAGALAERQRGSVWFRIPLIKTLYGFALANVGFAVGGIRALMGVRTTAYSK